MRSLVLDVNLAVTGNAATVTAPLADAPFNILQQVSFTTSSGDSLLVSVDGFALAMMNKFGAFSVAPPYCDPRADQGYTPPVAGSASTSGSFNFRVRIPMEIDPTQGYCSLPNMAANRTYYIQGLINPLTALFATPPTAATATLTITATAEYWSVPNPSNATGDAQQQEPVGNGSFSLWQLETIPVNAGSGIYQLHNVGGVIRQILFIYRDNTGARTTAANWPALAEILLNNDLLLYNRQADYVRRVTAQTGYGAQYGAVAAAVGTPQGQELGVWPLLDFMAPGDALIDPSNPRDQYLPTLDSTLLQIRGTSWGAAGGTLQVYTNSINSVSADALYAPHF
jgi:hypothetical protein